MSKPIIEQFTDRDAQLWGNHPVRLKHTLSSTNRFTDEAIAELIERVPDDQMAINTMAPEGHKLSSWSYIDRADSSGKNTLDMVKSGRLWVSISRLEQLDKGYAQLVDQKFEEFQGYMPEFDTFKRSAGLLISSPKAQVFYHSDPPGQSLWQIRGRKRLYIYPSSEPFLMAREIENVIRAVTEEEITYHQWYDDYCQTFDLEAGDMLHWPLNMPHRVVNLGTVNISMTSEHWTPKIRRNYAMNYGNGVLRDMGFNPTSRSLDGPAFWGKVALTAAWRLSGMHSRKSFQRKFDYQIDAAQSDSLSPIDSA